MGKTTIQIDTELGERIRLLAKKRSKKLGLPETSVLSSKKYLEMLIADEEERINEEEKK